MGWVFALLTPFYFLNAGMKVYLPALWAGLGLVIVLLIVKIRFAEKEEINLLVLGRQGHSRIARFILGSTTDRVSEHCHCTVMIVK